MELQFEKVGKRWVAEFEATGNFNLNIERVEPSKIKIYQKGSEEGEYASSASWEINYAPSVVDNDFSALIYPKFIKVVSDSEPIQGIVTMDGEGGSSGSGGGLRPVTADDVALFLTQDQYYIDSEKIEFQDTITIGPHDKLFIKQLNPLSELAVLYTPNLIDSKTQVNVWTPTKELFIYNNNSQNVDFNIENVYIKD